MNFASSFLNAVAPAALAAAAVSALCAPDREQAEGKIIRNERELQWIFRGGGRARKESRNSEIERLESGVSELEMFSHYAHNSTGLHDAEEEFQEDIPELMQSLARSLK